MNWKLWYIRLQLKGLELINQYIDNKFFHDLEEQLMRQELSMTIRDNQKKSNLVNLDDHRKVPEKREDFYTDLEITEKKLIQAQDFMTTTGSNIDILIFNSVHDATAFLHDIQTVIAQLEFTKNKYSNRHYKKSFLSSLNTTIQTLSLLANSEILQEEYDAWNSFTPFEDFEMKLNQKELKSLCKSPILLLKKEMFKESHPIYRSFLVYKYAKLLIKDLKAKSKNAYRRKAA